MGALSDEQRNTLLGCFHMRGFSEMFPIINQYYEQYKLGTDMTDDEKISEYTYVNEQLRKFAFKNQDRIMSHGSNLDDMLAEVEAMVESAGEYSNTRKGLMYNFIRDAWLLELHNAIMYLIDTKEE